MTLTFTLVTAAYIGISSFLVIRTKDRIAKAIKSINKPYATDEGYYYRIEERMSNGQYIVLRCDKEIGTCTSIGFYTSKSILSSNLDGKIYWNEFLLQRWDRFYKCLDATQKQYVDKYQTITMEDIKSMLVKT